MPSAHRPVRTALAALAVATMVLGSFLPWLRSGDTSRSSYQVLALTEHFDLVDNALISAVLTIWVGLPVACAACVVTYALRPGRGVGISTSVLAIFVGTVAVLGIVQGSATTGPVGISLTGPVVTGIGAIAALANGIATVVAPMRIRDGRERRAGVRP